MLFGESLASSWLAIIIQQMKDVIVGDAESRSWSLWIVYAELMGRLLGLGLKWRLRQSCLKMNIHTLPLALGVGSRLHPSVSPNPPGWTPPCSGVVGKRGKVFPSFPKRKLREVTGRRGPMCH